MSGGVIDGDVLIRADESDTFKLGADGIQCITGRLTVLREVTLVYPVSAMGSSLAVEPALTASDILMAGVHLVIESRVRIQDQQTLVIFKGSNKLAATTQFASGIRNVWLLSPPVRERVLVVRS